MLMCPIGARLQRMTAMADIVKISDEDLDWLDKGTSPEYYAKELLENGTSLVVITRGKDGAIAYTEKWVIEQAIVKTTVVDTVGAGDAFMAGLLSSLREQELLSIGKISAIDKLALAQALLFASQVAAITVSRKGANSPWKAEICC